MLIYIVMVFIRLGLACVSLNGVPLDKLVSDYKINIAKHCFEVVKNSSFKFLSILFSFLFFIIIFFNLQY